MLGLNIDMLKNPSQMADYMERTTKELGHIFKLPGLPAMPEFVCVVDPADVETVFRTGDTDYPMRFPFQDWVRARKELNQPSGMFLE